MSARFDARRVDLIANYNFGALTGSVQFANYQAQPVIGYDVRREGLAFSSRYKISDNYFAQGNITFDMSRHLYPPAVIGYTNPGAFAIAAYGIGGGLSGRVHDFFRELQLDLSRLRKRVLGAQPNRAPATATAHLGGSEVQQDFPQHNVARWRQLLKRVIS